MSHEYDASPINPLPPVVVALSLVIAGVEIAFQAGNAGLAGGAAATGWRVAALDQFGFYEPLFNWMVEARQLRGEHLIRFVSYPFVHGSFTHAAFALVFLLALGKMVGEVFNGWAVLIVYFGASIAGALAYGLVWDTQVMLFGGLPAAYGLIGAYSFLLWAHLAGSGENRMRAFSLIAFLMAFQLIFGLLFGASKDWVADLAGFGAGFGLSFLVSPGGWGRFVTALRRR